MPLAPEPSLENFSCLVVAQKFRKGVLIFEKLGKTNRFVWDTKEVRADHDINTLPYNRGEGLSALRVAIVNKLTLTIVAALTSLVSQRFVFKDTFTGQHVLAKQNQSNTPHPTSNRLPI